MTLSKLLLRNLLHYWRTNLAVLAGVAVATAVIAGALVLGDSVRYSLQQMSLDRLGQIDHLLTGPRFFRELLAEELQPALGEAVVAPALVMQGTIEFGATRESAIRAGKIQVYGVDQRCWDLLDTRDISLPKPGEIVLNQGVATQLSLHAGDTITLIVEIPASIPRDALLGEREETVTTLELKVAAIAPDETGPARLGFNPSQQLPLNAFVSLAELQQQTGLAAVPRSRRQPIAKPARVNTLLFGKTADLSTAKAEELTELIQRSLQLDDLALRLTVNENYGYLALESDQMMLENGLAEAAVDAATHLQIRHSPILVYLLNEMTNPAVPEKHSMYSVVAGIDLATLPRFEFLDAPASSSPPLGPGQAYINEWLAEDLALQPGGQLHVKYHVVGDRGELPEEEGQFEITGVVRLTPPADDRGFAPNVPGVTDADSYADWREPFPLKRSRITSRDDSYWEDHRTTPKVFVSLAEAQRLWRSRYGDLTSIRLMPAGGEALSALGERFSGEFLHRLRPETSALIVQPIKQQGLQAAQGTTDFTGLFIGFSFFLILSATILVGLLFRLGIEQRVGELGLLQAVGFTPQQVRRQFLTEGALVVLAGSLCGMALAVGYASLMLYGLKTWWIGAIGTRFLVLSVAPASLLIGAAIAISVALLAIVWSLRESRNVSSRQLLSGVTSVEVVNPSASGYAASWPPLPLWGALLLLVASLAGWIPEQEAFGGFSWKVVLFFLSGPLMLWGLLSWQNRELRLGRWGGVRGSGLLAELGLAWRNASRNRARTILSTSLLALAAFVIMAVAAGQQNPVREEPDRRSGNGGFRLVAESNLPLLYDLNTPAGRGRFGFNNSDALVQQAFAHSWIAQFRMRSGENASCLNLYQTRLPTILGVPSDVLQRFTEERRFLFADTPHAQPWEQLRELRAGGAIPVLGDMNTLRYSLHLGIGSRIDVPAGEDTSGGQLEIVGMLANSVLQGVLVMSEEHFRTLFPREAGFRYFLIDCPAEDASTLSNLLEQTLGDSGFDAEPTVVRLANFLAVQNTYLSTFQTLGGLGLLLGTLGLATVMLRNVLERRSELALLRAVGLTGQQVGRVILWEHALLLVSGVASGAIAAAVAMGPHLLSSGADVPWGSLLTLLLAVLLVGLSSAVLAVRAAVQLPILSTLRGE
jgi:ABC-type antimicrobial peptide transport system permease subunit